MKENLTYRLYHSIVVREDLGVRADAEANRPCCLDSTFALHESCFRALFGPHLVRSDTRRVWSSSPLWWRCTDYVVSVCRYREGSAPHVCGYRLVPTPLLLRSVGHEPC